MSDMTAACAPRSDQINAEDLLGGITKTITITKVSIKTGEQPVTINYEGDNGRPYKPCKTCCKLMVAIWGNDSARYIGKSMTLYNDPAITWGGMAVGGIRISHMSDMAAPKTLALAANRASKKLITVNPLVSTTGKPKVETPPDSKLSKDQQQAVIKMLSDAHIEPQTFKDAFGVVATLGELKTSQWDDISGWIDGNRAG